MNDIIMSVAKALAIIKVLRKHIDLAFNIMTAEQQALWLTQIQTMTPEKVKEKE